MSNELTTVDFHQLPTTQIGDDNAFEEISKGSQEFLPRLQLYTKGSAIDQGLITPGHWGIPDNDDVTDLGPSVDILPLARRPKAIDLSDTEAIVTNYDVGSETFQEIMERSLESNSGCMYGPSFLVWERSSGQFLEFFCGSKSTRSEAKKIYPALPVTEADIKARGLSDVEPHGPIPITMRSKLVKKKAFSWHVPVIGKCSTPLDGLPSNDVIIREIQRFVNPSEDNIEKVTETVNRRAR